MSMGHVCPRCDELEEAITANDAAIDRLDIDNLALAAALEKARVALELMRERAAKAIEPDEDHPDAPILFHAAAVIRALPLEE